LSSNYQLPGIFSSNALKPQVSAYYGLILYGFVLILSVIMLILAGIKIAGQNRVHKSFFTFIWIFVAPIVINLTYVFDKLGGAFNLNIVNSQQSVIMSVVGYTIAAIAINLFILKIINFRERIKRIIIILAYIQGAILVVLDIALIVLYLTNANSDVFDALTAVGGLLTILAMIFTIIALIIESTRTASKMIRLRLRLAVTGTLFVLLEGLGNAISVIFELIGLDPQRIMINLVVPGIAIVGYTTYIMGYYFTLFPPVWLQKITGVIPPSFLELVQKEEQLRKATEVS
jgi:hypothetical protein